MNRFSNRIRKLEKAKDKGRRQTHFIICENGETEEQVEEYKNEKRVGENDTFFIMHLGGEQ